MALSEPSKVPSPVSEQPRRADTPSPIEHRRRDRRDQWITMDYQYSNGQTWQRNMGVS